MSLDVWAVVTALFAATITPGPNNAICASIGVTHGFSRALPFSLGVATGFPSLLGAVGLAFPGC